MREGDKPCFSYGAFGLVNPAFAMAATVARFSRFQVPKSPKTTFNVGLYGGGTSVPSTRPATLPSLPPVGHDPILVQSVPPEMRGGQDRDGVQDGFDDGDLPGEVEGLPDFL